MGCIGSLFLALGLMILGGSFFGFWGAVFGAAIGLMWGGGWSQSRSSFEWGSAKERQEEFRRVSFLLMGCVAKADGRVSEREIHFAELAMDAFNLEGEHRRQAIKYFRTGVRGDFDLQSELEKLPELCGGSMHLASAFIEAQVLIAGADGEFSPSEQELICQFCDAIDYPHELMWRYVDAHRTGQGRHQNRSQEYDLDLEQAYQLLEVEASASTEEIQKAYARKMKDFHPDKLASKGLPKEFMNFANEQTKKYTKAYQTIKQARR